MTDRVTFDESAEQKRHNRDCVLWALLYGAAIFVGAIVLAQFDVPYWGVILVALGPMPPALMAFRAWLRWYRALDEVQRHVQSESLLITLAIVAIASLSYGFLEMWAGFPHFQVVFLSPVIAVAVSFVRPFVARRYR